MHTFLSGVDGDNRPEWTFPLVVVNSDLYLKRRKGLDAFVFKDVSGGLGGRYGGLHPTRGSVGSKGHDVAEPWSVLQLLWNRLPEREKKHQLTNEINILSCDFRLENNFYSLGGQR